MAAMKTRPTGEDVTAFLDAVPDERRRAVGFSPRKAALTLYGVHDGYGPPDPLHEALGPHTTGKGCLYLKHLDTVDLGVLERLVRRAWERAGT